MLNLLVSVENKRRRNQENPVFIQQICGSLKHLKPGSPGTTEGLLVWDSVDVELRFWSGFYGLCLRSGRSLHSLRAPAGGATDVPYEFKVCICSRMPIYGHLEPGGQKEGGGARTAWSWFGCAEEAPRRWQFSFCPWKWLFLDKKAELERSQCFWLGLKWRWRSCRPLGGQRAQRASSTARGSWGFV